MRQVAVIFLLITALPAAAVDKIDVVGLFKDKAVVEIDGRPQVLKVGETRADGIKLISANSKEAVIEIAGRQTTYQVGASTSIAAMAPPEGTIVQIGPDAQGMYLADGTINGYSVKFLVDTGATTLAMNRETAKRLGIDYRVDGKSGTARTASGIVKAYGVTLKKVTVGDIALNDVQAIVIDGDSPAEPLLGNTFLGRLDIKRSDKILELIKK
ncbi:MAG TPA: TIGR02281 family clan AA aspartic protease [Gammaproteobacteria bacterium]|nr:TIGR02281 family clan AA aspartic protease [Gammaproteobacteria bacterium]